MKKIEIKEIKNIELEILKDIDRVCRESDIKYSLTSGTLIGAVRHKGFIPWDDDIDIMMTRENYNKFIEIYPKKNNKIYKLLSHDINKQYYHQFIKIVDTRTFVKERRLREVDDMGIWVDIFPVDSISTKFLKLRLKKLEIFQGSLKKAKGDLKISKRNKFVKLIKKIFFINKIDFWYNKTMQQVKKESKNEKNDLKGILLSDSTNPISLLVDKKFFDDYTEIEFESQKFMVIKEYDKYLKHVYGDYMKIPPIEKRESHNMEAYFK